MESSRPEESNRCANWSIRRTVPFFPSPFHLLAPFFFSSFFFFFLFFFFLHITFGIPRSFAPSPSFYSTSNSRGNKNLIGRFLCSPLRIEQPPLEAEPRRRVGCDLEKREGQSDTHNGVELTFRRSRYFFPVEPSGPSRGYGPSCCFFLV